MYAVVLLFTTVTVIMEEDEGKKRKRNLYADICNGLAILTAVIIFGKGFFVKGDIEEVITWAIIPCFFLVLAVGFRLPAILIGIQSVVDYMEVGGMPLIGLMSLVLVFGLYIYSEEKKLLEAIKYIVGFTTGAFLQKKRQKSKM